MIKTLSYLCIILAVLSLLIGYFLAGFWPGAAFSAAVGLLWLAALWREWRPVTGLSLGLLAGAAALGTWLEVSTGWLLFGIVAALAAWDLGDFSYRFGKTEHIHGYESLQRKHLQRLGVVAGAGLLLGSIALSIQLQLNMWWGILLGVLVVIGLSQAIGRLRRESD